MTQIRQTILCFALAFLSTLAAQGKKKPDVSLWPDSTPMEAWFSDTTKVDIRTLGRLYQLTDYGVKADSTILQTDAVQRVIDRCASDGGGVVVIPTGMTVLSGALFFKPKTHLRIEKGARLKGIDDIRHYPLIDQHIEGKMIKYFAALVTAIGCDGFTITGNTTDSRPISRDEIGDNNPGPNLSFDK